MRDLSCWRSNHHKSSGWTLLWYPWRWHHLNWETWLHVLQVSAFFLTLGRSRGSSFNSWRSWHKFALVNYPSSSSSSTVAIAGPLVRRWLLEWNWTLKSSSSSESTWAGSGFASDIEIPLEVTSTSSSQQAFFIIEPAAVDWAQARFATSARKHLWWGSFSSFSPSLETSATSACSTSR